MSLQRTGEAERVAVVIHEFEVERHRMSLRGRRSKTLAAGVAALPDGSAVQLRVET